MAQILSVFKKICNFANVIYNMERTKVINPDWDLLILLDKPHLVADDYDATYPFRELGWDIGEEISPHIYTKKQWSEWTFLPYYKNVERDKIVLI